MGDDIAAKYHMLEYAWVPHRIETCSSSGTYYTTDGPIVFPFYFGWVLRSFLAQINER